MSTTSPLTVLIAALAPPIEWPSWARAGRAKATRTKPKATARMRFMVWSPRKSDRWPNAPWQRRAGEAHWLGSMDGRSAPRRSEPRDVVFRHAPDLGLALSSALE